MIERVPAAWTDAITQAAITGANGDAWAIIIQQSRRYLMRVLTANGANWDQADELVQLTYARAWERRAQFGRNQQFDPTALRAWLTTIAVNAWRDQLRHQNHRTITLVNHCELGQQQAWEYVNAPAHEPTTEQLTIRAEEMAIAAATITRLASRISPQHRRRVRLLLDAHSGYAQRSGAPRVDIRRVMAATGLQRSAAKSAMHRVRLALRHAALEGT